MARKPDVRSDKTRSWAFRGRGTGFTLVLSLLLVFFGYVLYLSAARGSSSSSSSDGSGGRWSATSKPLLLPNQQAATVTSAAAAAEHSAGLPCLTLLQQLLPRANFSTLSTADLLDAAAAAKLDSLGMRQLMQLQQGLFCRSEVAAEQMPNTVQVQFKAATVHVYASNDMVSNSIAKSSSWETTEVEHVLWALQQTTPQQQQQQQPLFVDIGANVGVFSVSAAAAGARVAAFEAMPSNVALLRRSLCSTPWLADKVALFGTGLGTKSAKCVIISDTVNRGDGHTVCDKDPQTAVMEAGWSNNHTYEVRGEMTVRRLDTLLAEDVQVMKIDVEGFELEVLQGAQGLLQKHNVWYIMAECNIGIIGRDGEQRFLRWAAAAATAAAAAADAAAAAADIVLQDTAVSAQFMQR
uniref:Methyltransferase FkbM domain-containing protein n=1 Tax=Tetradesmus obliquus TaxID=3088 RepID=A0A383VEQ7_TETOB|eukprot:jgi/Sobl393_1/2132/SZX62856.1